MIRTLIKDGPEISTIKVERGFANPVEYFETLVFGNDDDSREVHNTAHAAMAYHNLKVAEYIV
jgi:hypothetical protein